MKFDTVVYGCDAAALGAATDALRQGGTCALVRRGLPLEKIDYSGFVAAGGLVFHAGAEVSADKYILATGRFFSGGLLADMEKVYEPVFGLDLDFPDDRSLWFDPDFNADQPFMRFGVVADADGHPFIGGVRQDNIIVIGDILRYADRKQ